jgi:L-threonylcarbamoyladenylate synthase
LIETKVIKISPSDPQDDLLMQAAEVLRLGGLVAFPTETVYGLGADALNAGAVKKVFEAKGRSPDNPLIVHIAEFDQIKALTGEVPEVGKLLADAFWPGPLTLVVKSSPSIPKVVTGGLETVAVRIPKHNVTLELIKKLNRPIVGPSANKSGRPSPTTAQHVYDDLDGKIELIIDSGPTIIGIESTVIDVTVSPPLILRFGGLTREKIEQLIGEVRTTEDEQALKKSPGTRYRHYAPEARVVLFERGDKLAFDQLFKKYRDEGKKVGYIVYTPELAVRGTDVKGKIVSQDLKKYSQQLFDLLRNLDKLDTDVILIESVEEVELGKAIMDRLRKAAEENKST